MFIPTHFDGDINGDHLITIKERWSKHKRLNLKQLHFTTKTLKYPKQQTQIVRKHIYLQLLLTSNKFKFKHTVKLLDHSWTNEDLATLGSFGALYTMRPG